MELEVYSELYDHQKKMVEKFSKLKVGANFMDMGTGKTLSMLALIKNKWNKIDRIFWFCPVSTKINLIRDIEKHSNLMELDMVDIYGIESLSMSDRVYSEVLNKANRYKKIMLIIDESTLIKNYFAKRSSRMLSIAGFCKYRFIMNGTPVTRDMTDLFSQFYILDHRILGYASYYSFAANHIIKDDYGKVTTVLNENYIMQRITPYTYKVRKEDCLDLPERNFNRRYFDLTDEQKVHYEYVKNKILENPDNLDETTIYRLITALQLITSGRRIENAQYLKREKLETTFFFDDPYQNPRIRTLLDIVRQEDCKTIIWCKYTHEIKDLKQVLSKEYGAENVALFYGSVPLKEREKEIDRFRNGARFLIANKSCGGYGLNLQFCSRSIYYNNDFDYATREQSLDRIYRIGQNNMVFVTDIIADSKIDERIIDCLEEKTKLENLVNKLLKKYNKTDIDEWLSFKREKGKGRRNGKNRVKQIEEATRDTEVS